MKEKIRYGMIGGADHNSFGKVHRLAAMLENDYELVCGAFSRDYEKSLSLNAELHLSPERVYKSYEEMIVKEAALPAEKRVQVISIVTPNHTHFEIAKLALQHGMHIILEKPITINLLQAKILQGLLAETDLKCMVCYTNTGFPMVKQAKDMLQSGTLGKIKLVNVQYYQGWLANFSSVEETKAAAWRCDPMQSGLGGTIADIGIHAFNLVEYITGQNINAINAELASLVSTRQLDDYASVQLKLNHDVRGNLLVCQAAIGEGWNLKITIYGEKASLKWELEQPDQLTIAYANKPHETLRAGEHNIILSEAALNNGRSAAGKGENSIDALANHFHNFAKAVTAHSHQTKPGEDYPSLQEGVRGMAFIETAVASNASQEKWLNFSEEKSYLLFKDLTKENCLTQLDGINQQIKGLQNIEDIKIFISHSLAFEMNKRRTEEAQAILQKIKHHRLFEEENKKKGLLFFPPQHENKKEEDIVAQRPRFQPNQ